MKKIIILLALFLAGCEEVNINLLADAGQDAFTAVTLSQEDIELLTNASRESLDSKHQIAQPANKYHERLFTLVEQNERFENQTYNFKVYESSTVNAFALPDGSIRIYSGLMDMLDDDELLFVIGHEMGHVHNKDALDKLRVAYGTRAVQKGLASVRGEVGQVSASWVGDLSNQIVNSQFSQQEEREADDYGLYYITVRGKDPNAAVSALEKLSTLGSSHTFLSTHPEPGSRAERLKVRIEEANSTVIEPKTLGEKGKEVYEDIQQKVAATNTTKVKQSVNKLTGFFERILN